MSAVTVVRATWLSATSQPVVQSWVLAARLVFAVLQVRVITFMIVHNFVAIPMHVDNTVLTADLGTQLEMLVNVTLTVDNFEAVVSELSLIANDSVVAVEEQTEANLGRIATAFNSVASLVANTSASTIVDNVVSVLALYV